MAPATLGFAGSFARKDSYMEFMKGTDSEVLQTLPRGVTPINDTKQQQKMSKTLSKAVSLHLEGKLENAAKVLTRAIESGEQDAGLFAALGHIQYEMRDYAAAASSYSQLAGLEPQHRTAHFNLGVCRGNLKDWGGASESFHQAYKIDPARAEALLGLGICLLHTGHPDEAGVMLDKYLSLLPGPRAGRLWQGGKLSADRTTRGSRGTVSQGAGAQPEMRGGAIEPGGHVRGEERPRCGPPLRANAGGAAARFAGGPGSPGNHRFRRRRLPGRHQLLPVLVGFGARPIRELV